MIALAVTGHLVCSQFLLVCSYIGADQFVAGTGLFLPEADMCSS